MNKKTVTFGGGCFWCTEAIFRETLGVLEVESGFSGGFIKNPAYREVCTGRTGHAEVIRVTYDADITSYASLLTIHLLTHDPTTLNKQGADNGTQYRSIIFYENDAEKLLATAAIAQAQIAYATVIVTELKPFEVFYAAEEKHQNYYEMNKDAFYCQIVINPKLVKYRQLKATNTLP